jgi:hypothetical protein
VTALGLNARGGFWSAVDEESRGGRPRSFWIARADIGTGLNGTNRWIRMRIIDLSAITKPMIG